MQSYDLTLAAEEDLRGIWCYTYETWGFDQAETYFYRIEACCEAVGSGRAQSKTLNGLPDGVRIHRCEHHYIVWLDEDRPIIIAILHERMDFVRRLNDTVKLSQLYGRLSARIGGSAILAASRHRVRPHPRARVYWVDNSAESALQVQ